MTNGFLGRAPFRTQSNVVFRFGTDDLFEFPYPGANARRGQGEGQDQLVGPQGAYG